MPSLWILLKDILLLLRNKKTFFLLIVMPLILIAILGFAFSNIFSENTDSELATYHIGVIDEDHSMQSETIVNDVLKDYMQNYFVVHEISESDIADQMREGNITVALIIPEGFGAKIEASKRPEVKLISTAEDSIETTIIEQALLQYDGVQTGITAATQFLIEYYTEQGSEGISPQSENIAPSTGETKDLLPVPFEEVTATGTEDSISSFQYYAVAMGVMFLLLTVITLVSTMIEEKSDTVYARQLTTNMLAWQYTLSKFIGIVLVAFLQLTIMIVVTSLFYGVNWGDSWGAILLTMLSFTISTAGLGVFVASFLKKEETFDSVGMIGTQIMSALGGSFVPIFLFPDWMATIAKVLPNSLALQMFLDIMVGGDVGTIRMEALTSFAVGLCLFALAWFRMSRKGGAS